MSRGGSGSGGPPRIEGMFSLKVDNISYNTTLADLRRLFDRYGPIGDLHIPREKYSGQSKGFAFVRYHSKRDAERAIDRLDGRRIDGREVRVAFARFDRPIDERSRAGGRGRSRSPRGRRGGRSRSRSRSPARRGRERSRSRSPRERRRSPSRSRSKSPSRSRSKSKSKSRSRSPSRSRSRSPSGSERDLKHDDAVEHENGSGDNGGGKSPSRSPSPVE